ncbi:MAG: hypothetical protein ABJD53_16835 [Gammaproteobacteria bacterium]
MNEQILRGFSSSTAAGSVVPGIILLAASLLEILAMAHHPSVDTSDITVALAQIAEFSEHAAVVHGVWLSLMLMVLYGCRSSRWAGESLVPSSAVGPSPTASARLP